MSRTRNKPLGLWRTLGLDIVNAGKSKQYAAAVECFGRAKRCFAVAGLPGSRTAGTSSWTKCARTTTAGASFIREFGKVVTRVTPEPEPSFLEKAHARWAPPE
jgi:hypothetical protein